MKSYKDNFMDFQGVIPLYEYEGLIKHTDQFNSSEFTPILLGLYGEIGSIMSASKKFQRENKAYIGYKEAVIEEFGDALWYFTALCRRLNVSLSKVFKETIDNQKFTQHISANTLENAPITQTFIPINISDLDDTLLHLGAVTAQLLRIDKNDENFMELLVNFSDLYLRAMHSIGLSFSQVVRTNIDKAYGRFSEIKPEKLPDFDLNFPEEEQLPRKFEIHITQRKSGHSYLRWNGVFIGSPLTDNIKNQDGYRFHDVFHFAHAAILHWSPTFRALIKQKRKSDPIFDETQDGGRAIVVEEGLTAWLYSYSKDLDFFEGHNSVSFDVLKTIQKFVNGYEVEKCPLKLWENAILQGYSVFRQVKKHNGGVIIGDRHKRTLDYIPFKESYEN